MKRSAVFAFVIHAIIYMNLPLTEQKGRVGKFCAVLSVLYSGIKSALFRCVVGRYYQSPDKEPNLFI